MSTPTDFERLRDLVYAKQTRVRFLADLDIRDAGGGLVEVLKNGHWEKMSPFDALETWKRREIALKLSIEDPFRQGHEPDAWDSLDWLVLRKRLENPGIAIEILILGGQGSGKSFFGARCLNRFGVYNPMCLVWTFSTDELNSKSVMQPAVYSYLPKELRTATGKAKRTRNQKIIYTTAGGFTGNVMGFPNGTVLQFRFHSSELATLEGPRPHFVVTDENVPLAWVEAITDRLRSRAQLSLNYSEEFTKVMEQKRAEPWMKFPPNLVSKLYMGVHIVMFTPKFGWTATVQAFMKDSVTLKEVDAELLPTKDEAGNPTGFERVPRELDCKLKRRAAFFMHPTDNPHAGNYESFKAERDTMTRETILWKVYGVATRKSSILFPKFSIPTHVRKESMLPKEGTWYHIVDPCPGRNMVMGWYKINPLGQIFVAREFPQEDDYIAGVGYPGPWAIEGQKLDGDKGPAQTTWGLGMQAYLEIIETIERDLHRIEGGSNEGGRIFIPEGNRIMDSRSGNTPTLEHDSAETLILKFGKLGLDFTPSGKASGAKDGDTKVEESTDLVSDLLDYDTEKIARDPETGAITFLGKSPNLYVNERCTNHIFSFSTWTNADGQKGACKDFMDLVRYLAMADPYHRETRKETEQQYSGVY